MIIKNVYENSSPNETTTEEVVRVYQNGAFDEELSKKDVVTEHRIEVQVNEQLVAQLVCTPLDLAELVTGRLITEQIISSADEVRQIYICEFGRRARVFLHDHNKKLRAFVESTPTCCTDNHVYMQSENDIEMEEFPETKWDPESILEIGAEIRKGFEVYRSTYGVHSAALIHNGNIVYRCEDIGRHNAVDKAIGYMAIHGLAPDECMLYTTGRAAVDMVRKSIRARIPVFLSKKSTTNAAVDLARTYRLTLISNVWEDRFNVFSPL